MSYGAQELTFLFEPPDGQPVLTSAWHLLLCYWIKESFMDDFGGTGDVVTFCSTNFAVGSNSESLIFEELDTFEPNRNLSCQLLALLAFLNDDHLPLDGRQMGMYTLIKGVVSTKFINKCMQYC